MSAFAANHYILILQNNYTKQAQAFDVLNTSEDRLFYQFENFEFPDNWSYGEYNFWLVWDTLEYSIEFANEILDSKITVLDDQGNETTLKLSNLTPDTGIIKYPDPNAPTEEQSLDEKTNYYSL